MATIIPGPTKDSNYSQKYVREGVYPRAARSVSASAIHQNISNQYPGYGEFDGAIAPSSAIQRAYEVFMRQSEFKKPYKKGGYREMETNADPLPGFRVPGMSDAPSVPSVDTPIIPDGFDPGIFLLALVDPDYEHGGFCRGNTVSILIKGSQPIYGVSLIGEESGTTLTPTTNFGFNDLYADIAADNGEFGDITLAVSMRSFEGVSGGYLTKIEEKICEEYCVIRFEGPVVDKVTVWGMIEEAVVTNIPTNDLLGVVSFPADFSEIATWLAGATQLTEDGIASADFSPSWLDGTITPTFPFSPSYLHSCSSAENSYFGGSWPHIDYDTTPASGANGIGCDSPSLTNKNYRAWEYKESVENCPNGTTKTDPLIDYRYGESEWTRRAMAKSAEITSNNLVSATQLFRTDLVSHEYSVYTEWADTTQIPNPTPPPPTIDTALGDGSYNGYMHYDYNVYSPLDSNPLVTYEHTVNNVETWSGTFTLGTVSGFVRTFDAVGIPRLSYSKAGALGYARSVRSGSVYGRHTAVQFFAFEALKVLATVNYQGYAGGFIANNVFIDWEDNANFVVTDEVAYRGVHAAAVYDEDEFADNLDICTLTRHNGLESAIEDLMDDYKSDAGLGADDIIPPSVATSMAILL